MPIRNVIKWNHIAAETISITYAELKLIIAEISPTIDPTRIDIINFAILVMTNVMTLEDAKQIYIDAKAEYELR